MTGLRFSHHWKWNLVVAIPLNIGRLLGSVRRKGVVQTFRFMMYRWTEWRWEKSLGLRTRQIVETRRLLGRQDAEDYDPTDFQIIRKVLERINVRPQQDVLLDIGCGKGRVLAVAALYPFLRVHGIELDPKLVTIAQSNLKRLSNRQRASDVTIEVADAANWPIPADVTTVFLFNPFYDETFLKMIDQLRRSWIENPRPFLIIYLQPVVHRNVLAEQNWLELVEELETWPRSDLRLCLYRPGNMLPSPETKEKTH